MQSNVIAHCQPDCGDNAGSANNCDALLTCTCGLELTVCHGIIAFHLHAVLISFLYLHQQKELVA